MNTADRIHDNQDGTLWVVPPKCPDERAPQGAHWGQGNPCVHGCRALDRPCDTCGGSARDFGGAAGQLCPACHGTGRHVFEIDVACEACGGRHDIPIGKSSGGATLRVHVVPDMVLPITDVWATTSPAIYHDPTSPISEWWWYYAVPDGWNVPITLPPAAKPSMYAIKLEALS